MSERLTIGQLYPSKIYPTAQNAAQRSSQHEASPTSFNQIFQDELLKFSNHATKRLEQRGIELKGEQLARIQNAVDKAAAKGSKESLILMKDMALIVNVANRTVVTAMDGSSMKDNVFTQIDSAVVIS
ncbi:TIGR02530 family flagellar biosynthesis protein [Paenibacillus sp.]|jgi:flagellar operon protein|uniref:TIGR02530 family flagellar biosynthesis protein n=1 Tax=Paenibacillus sp. TaxID=58172 RepID=UPI00281EB454|nr:TIGR02530 family flagellar biosynthesis protein [Paenibacillus sp.]MDR0270077.1 flagellar biosynthesis protein [Paenibacillus sp.]